MKRAILYCCLLAISLADATWRRPFGNHHKNNHHHAEEHHHKHHKRNTQFIEITNRLSKPVIINWAGLRLSRVINLLALLILETSITTIITCLITINRVIFSIPWINCTKGRKTIKSNQLLFMCFILCLLNEISNNISNININKIVRFIVSMICI